MDSSGSGSSSGYYDDGMYAGAISNGGSATSSFYDSNDHDSGGAHHTYSNGNGNGGNGGGTGVVSSKLDPRINRERIVATS